MVNDKKGLLTKLWQDRWAYIFISPFYLLFFIFMLYPIIFSFYLSFFEWPGIGDMTYIGLENFFKLFTDGQFWIALKNTLIMGVGYVPIMLLGALILASILNSKFIKNKGIFRTIYFLPVVTSLVVVALVFLTLYDNEYGLFNYVFRSLGLGKIPWLSSTFWSKPSIMILLIWRWLGYNMVIMLAGLQSIPSSVYESAKIDGANTTQVFFRITIPLMKPVILFCLIMSTVGTFQLFAEPFILTNGGPADSSLTMGLFLYNNAFNYFKFGYSSALAYVMAGIIFALSLVQFKGFGQTS